MSDFYRRNLPHYQPAGGEFFVTFRLANSLPKSILNRLKREFKNLKREVNKGDIDKLNKKYFGKFDALLDSSKNGNFWLQKDVVAEIVADKLHNLDNKLYLLISYCIMPNHVHMLFKLSDRDESRSTYRVTKILRLIKGSTARQANKLIGRTGPFWQHESYDHLVRNDEERERIIRYILNNPIKAGLVKRWTDWKWSYYKEKYLPVR